MSDASKGQTVRKWAQMLWRWTLTGGITEQYARDHNLYKRRSGTKVKYGLICLYGVVSVVCSGLASVPLKSCARKYV